MKKINLPSVNQSNGVVEMSKNALFKNWKKTNTIEDILLDLKNQMKNNKNLPQPAEGSTF